eukprot:TRINITY_DN2327_c0_g1_i15.p2 TRINITY_DN2327_c0_g1~~TRINITY_DN2327_c0_g1_i15.p2  ORF type:complete len:326 (-),score=66.47 TRINITY_DN2327_c0_g1_i15:1392-2369(-)
MSNESPQMEKKNNSMYFSATVTGLPQRLRLASLRRDQVPMAVYHLLRVFFMETQNNRFISYSETHEEVSMILEESAASSFPEGLLNLSTQFWKAIEFTGGSSPSTDLQWHFVKDVSEPLGRAGIPIFFFTTFNSDLILVEESNFDSAKRCLKANLPILWADEEPTSNIQGPSYAPGPCNVLADPFRKLQAFPEISLYFTSIRKEAEQSYILDLIRLLFYAPPRPSRFISFTQNEDEISLILDGESLSQIPNQNLEIVLEDAWVPIRRRQKAGFTETGVVSAISSPLGSLSMLYLSTFHTGWFMVRKEDLEKAKLLLSVVNFTFEQ